MDVIFEYIRFRNYRLYYGEQTIYFRDQNHISDGPVKKNIVLIGGLNGHGKTSLIQAINICLFGRLKFKNDREYGEFLSKAVNHRYLSEGGKEGSVELAFTDEDQSTYAINVAFRAGETEEIRKMYLLDSELNIKEEIQLSEEEIIDFIDQRIPVDVSHFFIFNAEKIRELLGDQNKEETRDAIQKVVQLNLYNQLLNDINKIQSDLLRDAKKLRKDQDVSELTERLEVVFEELVKIEDELEKIDKNLEILESDEVELNIKRRKLYANNLQSKQKIIKDIGKKEKRLEDIEKRLRNLKSKELQRIILQKPIKDLKDQLREEKKYLDAKLLEKAKFAPYEAFINKLLATNIEPPISEKQKEQLKKIGKKVWADINNIRQDTISKEINLLHNSLSSEEYQFLIDYPEIQSSTVKEDVNEKQKLEKEIQQCEKMLINAPEAVDTSAIEKEIAKINQKKGQLNEKRRNLVARKNRLDDEKADLTKKINRTEKVSSEYKMVNAQLNLTNRLYKGLHEFIERITLLKANQLKEEIEVILYRLFRKADFRRIEFDPSQFQLRIYDRLNQLVEIDARSEGEKQIVALAMIWALTKVSGSKFPFVIDTPVARLDSAHRSNLVDHYFTKLSDQVIILSIDTEITEEFYQLLRPFIGKEYMLEYDDDKGITRIKEGYLF